MPDTITVPSPDRVAVIIVNWNSGELLSLVVQGLMTQTVQGFRLLVVDNASSDDSLTLASNKCSWIETLPQSDNLGFAAANNLAVAAVEGCDWVALLNPDAIPDPRWLENLLSAAAAYPECHFFGSRQMLLGRPGVLDGVGDAYHVCGISWRKGHGTNPTLHTLGNPEIFSPCAAAALYRRDSFLRAGGFDEGFFCYMEDVDLGFRLRLLGHRCLLVPSAVVHHASSATTGGQHSDFAVYHGHRNLVWTFVKDMPGALFWLLLPLHILLNLVTLMRFTVRGQGRVILRAKWDAIKGLPRAWAKRKKIQANRVATVGEIWRVLDKRLIPIRRGR